MPLPVLLILSATSSLAALAPVATATHSELYGSRAERGTVTPEEARGWKEPPGLDPEHVLLFVPRALLFPVEWTLLAVFRPLEELLAVLEEYAVIEHAIDFLYNDERTAGFLPILTVLPDSGVSGGASVFHHDLFGHGERLTAKARFGGLYRQRYELAFAADTLAGTRLWLEAQARWEVSPRLRYFGIGDELGPEARFSQTRWLGRLRFGRTFGEEGERVKVGASAVFNDRRFAEGHRLDADEASIENVYDTAEIVGFDSGVDLFELSADLVLDFRDRPGFTSSGIFVDAFAGGAPPQESFAFAHWGAELIVFANLYHRTRVLVVRAGMEAVDGADDAIPFSELPRLGGTKLLRGYPIDAFRDQKSAFGSVEYRWRIHKNVEVRGFLDAGRVAHDYAGIFEAAGWHFGGGGAVSIGSEDVRFLTFELAYGDGTQVFLAAEIAAFSDWSEEL